MASAGADAPLAACAGRPRGCAQGGRQRQRQRLHGLRRCLQGPAHVQPRPRCLQEVCRRDPGQGAALQRRSEPYLDFQRSGCRKRGASAQEQWRTRRRVVLGQQAAGHPNQCFTAIHGYQQRSMHAERGATCMHAAQVGDSLSEFLVEATADPKLRQLMTSMSEAIRTIAYKVRRLQLLGAQQQQQPVNQHAVQGRAAGRCCMASPASPPLPPVWCCRCAPPLAAAPPASTPSVTSSWPWTWLPTTCCSRP